LDTTVKLCTVAKGQSVHQTASEESARRRIARLPEFIQDYLYKYVGGGSLEYLAEYGESLVKAGTTKADLAPIEVQDKAPPDPEFKFVQAAQKGRYSQFLLVWEFKKDLSRNVALPKNRPGPLGSLRPILSKERNGKTIRLQPRRNGTSSCSANTTKL